MHAPPPNFKKSIQRVGASAAAYNASPSPISSGSPVGIGIVNSLKMLQRDLEALLLMMGKSNFCVIISKGQGNIPRILYAAISRARDRLSTEPCVCLCFNEVGTGFVVGMMYPMNYFRSTKHQKVVRSGSDMTIDLSSKRSKSNFNNLFVNPAEYLTENLHDETLFKHISASIEILEIELAR